MMKKIFLILIFLLSISLAAATYITITTTISSQVILDNSTTLHVSLKQSGDEAAYDVNVEPLATQYFSSEDILNKDKLNPGETLSGNMTLSFLGTLPGKYPLVVLTIYHDANMYPFSTLSPHILTYKKGYPSGIYGSINQIEISKDGSGYITLSLRNLDETTHTINIKLYLPRELNAGETEKIISLGPKEEKELKYKISSMGALPGSTYSILASLEYEENGYHYGTFASGLVKIVEKKEVFGLSQWWIGIVVVILITIFVIYQFWSWKNEKKKKRKK